MPKTKRGIPVTVDELIATLNRSSLPTLIAEGVDDLIFLRSLEDRFLDCGLSILTTGGRSIVLQLFERKNELHQENVVLFLADRDVWVNTGLPEQYNDQRLIFTEGYSLENDLYRDGQLERLLFLQERQNFDQELRKFLSWYVLALSRHLVNPENSIGLHPGKILDDDTFYKAQLTLSPNEIYPSELLRIIEGDYQKLLRGKSLLALLLRQLSAKHRSVKHSSQTLMENSAKSGGVKVQRIETWIAAHLGKSAVDQTLNTTSL